MSSINLDAISEVIEKSAREPKKLPMYSSPAKKKAYRVKGSKDGSNFTKKHAIKGSDCYLTLVRQIKTAKRIWEQEAEVARREYEASKKSPQKVATSSK